VNNTFTIISQGVNILVGIATLVTLVWTRINAVSAARKAEASANAAANHALSAVTGVNAMASTLEKVVVNTNGMSHRLEELAGKAGEVRGRQQEKDRERNA